MDDLLTADASVLFLFLYMLPGFLGQIVYGYLVEGQPQDKFDRVVTAFVLSLLALLIVHGVLGVPFFPVTAVTKDTPISSVLQAMVGLNLMYSSIAAVLVAMVIAVLNNHHAIYEVLNVLRISYKTGNSDVWQDVFYRHRKFWFKINFADGRSLVGWPKYFSASGKERELFMGDASWWHHDQNGRVTGVEDVPGPGVYLSDFATVLGIEIMK